MEIEIMGVGEAFDETQINNSYMIHSSVNLLLDCGYSLPHELWKKGYGGEYVDAIYITHEHADHCFGLPSFVLRMAEEKRKKKLTIICQKGLAGHLEGMMHIGYSVIPAVIPFEIEYIEVNPGDKLELGDMKLEFAFTTHSVSNMAIKISKFGKSFCYSGDGTYTDASKELFRESDLVFHEAYYLDEMKNGHTSIKACIDLVKELSIKRLALTHLQRDLRKEILPTLKDLISDDIDVFIPEKGDRFTLD